jgi:hypothetical protein
MHRVLKRGGTALIIDLRKDFSPQAVRDYVRGRGIFDAFIVRTIFNTVLKKRAYTKESMTRSMAQSRFGRGADRLRTVASQMIGRP